MLGKTPPSYSISSSSLSSFSHSLQFPLTLPSYIYVSALIIHNPFPSFLLIFNYKVNLAMGILFLFNHSILSAMKFLFLNHSFKLTESNVQEENSIWVAHLGKKIIKTQLLSHFIVFYSSNYACIQLFMYALFICHLG